MNLSFSEARLVSRVHVKLWGENHKFFACLFAHIPLGAPQDPNNMKRAKLAVGGAYSASSVNHSQ